MELDPPEVQQRRGGGYRDRSVRVALLAGVPGQDQPDSRARPRPEKVAP
jgi:hypothetical protein